MPSDFKPGDVVQFTQVFLQSIGWYTNVPADGLVVEAPEDAEPFLHHSDRVYVHWCDRDAPCPVNKNNLKLRNAWEPN